jgi:hypothetical protein
MENEKTFLGLRRFNIIMSILHFAQGAAVLALSNNFTLPIMSNFLKFDIATQQLAPSPNILINLKIGPLVAGFFFLSSLAHLLVSMPKINDWYAANLKKGINYARWIEYSFSSSLMIFIIAMLAGIYDISALILIFFLNASMILFGWMMEKQNQTTTKVDWSSFIFGCIAGAVCWAVIAIYLFGAGDADNKAPAFVYWIFFSLFVFFDIFALNMYLQYRKVGRWSDYLYGERMYIVLSLVAKSLLAWQVFAGTLRPV